MAGFDGSIRIDTLLNTRGFERGARGLLSGMERLGNSIRGIMGSLGFAIGIAGLVSLGKQAIDTASDIQEVQNVVDTAFGSMAYKMEEFAKTSVKQFGISQLSAKQMGSTFMAMGASMLDNMEEASDMAINLTARAADMSSFYNKSIEETSYALKSIYTGETESLKEYGVVMTQVNMEEFARQQGINKSIQAMTQAEKVELQYAYVMQQTALAAGDFAKTSDSWANQTRILSEQFKELLSVIGSGLIVVFTPVVKFLNTILTGLIAIAKQIGAILSKLFGIKVPVVDSSKMASNLSDAAGGANDLADGMDSAGSAAKKAGKEASKALAPFDKLNVLKQDKGGSSVGSGSGGGAGGAGGGGFELPELSFGEEAEDADAFGSALDGVLKRLKELKDLFVKGFFEGLGDYKPVLEELKKDIMSIGQTLKEIFTDPEVIAAANRLADQISYSLGQVIGSAARNGLTIAQLLVGGIEKYLTQNKDRIKQYIISMFDIGTEIAANIGDFSVAFADIFSVFGGDTAQQIAANLIGIFAEVGMLISENAAKLGRDILNMITQPIIDNKDKIKDAIEGTLQAIEPFTSGLLSAIQKLRDAISEVYDKHLKPLFDSIASGISKIVGKLLDGYNEYIVPVLQGLGERFKEIMEGPFGETVDKVKDFIGKLIDAIKLFWEEVLVPFFSWMADNIMPVLAPIIDFIGNTVLTVFESIIKVVGDIADALGGIVDFVVGAFMGDWKKAWNGIKKVFSSVWDAIKDIFSGAWEIIKNLAKNGVDFVKKIISAAWNGIKSLTSTVWNGIKGVVTGVWNGIKALASSIFNGIKTAISNVWNGIKVITSTVWNLIKTILSGIWNGLKSLVSTIFNGIKSVISAVWNTIKTVTSTIWNGIKGVVSGIWNGIKSLATSVFNGIKSVISNTWNGIKTATSKVWNLIKSILSGIWNGLKATVSSIFSAIKEVITKAWNAVKTATTNVWNGIKTAVSNAINLVKDIISGAMGSVKGIWDGIWDGIFGKVSGILESIKTIIRNVFGWISDMVKDLLEKIGSIGTGATSAVGGAFGGLVGGMGKAAPYANQAAAYSPAMASFSDMQIPQLASGAVIRGGNPFLAVLGDQRFGQTNVEAPLSTIEKAVSNAMGKAGGMGGDISVRVFIGGKDVTRAVKTEADTYFKKTGKDLFMH